VDRKTLIRASLAAIVLTAAGAALGVLWLGPAQAASGRSDAPEPAASAAEKAVSASSGGCTASASISDPTPRQGSHVTLTGQLNCPDGAGNSSTMTTVWKFPAGTVSCNAPVSKAGKATCSVSTSNAHAGATVSVDVNFVRGSQNYRDSVTFTPR
jgi:hypothetical protein